LAGNGFDSPSIRVMMFKVLPPRDPTEKHRFGDPPLFRANGEIHVRNHEPNQGYAGQSMRHVDEAPRCVAQKVRIAREEWRSDPNHHRDTAHYHRETCQDDGHMVEAITEWILAGFWAGNIVAKFA